MTTQVSERIIYRGRTEKLATTPLESFLRAGGKKTPFDDADSDLWRGYIGTWQIEDGRLYLREVTGKLKDGTYASVSSLFPSSSGRVLAEWFTGTLSIGKGRLLSDDLVCFAQYEHEVLVEIEDGVVKGTSSRRNRVGLS